MSKTILCPECGLHDVEIEETINESMDKIIDSQKMDIYPNMSNSTQNDEIGKMEKAIDEGFAESERDLKDKKTPLDQPTQNDWEVRFNDRFLNNWGTLLDIKHFIRKELADARREVIEKVESLKIAGDIGGTDVMKLMGEMDVNILHSAKSYNKAIDDVLATLREEESK